MNAPHSIEVSRPPFARAVRAITEIDGISKLAILCILVGWFVMNTLVVSLGSLQHGVRFYDFLAVIVDPTRLFFDAETPFQRIAFGIICLGCLTLPLVPHLKSGRATWLGYAAPLALMVLCGAMLYSRTSGEFFSAPLDAKSMSDSLLRFADDLVRRGGLVTRHLAIGAGGYLASIASMVLGAQGVRRMRARGRARTGRTSGFA